VIRRASFAAILLMSACGPANAEPVAPGVYSSVTLSEETGDLGGAELELIGSGSDARVELVICEGWCNAIHRAPVTLTADGFNFSYVEEYVDQDGAPSSSQTFDAVGVSKGTGATLTITPAGSEGWFFGYVLKPIDERFGLAVAAGD
jgi:hypothetical protein